MWDFGPGFTGEKTLRTWKEKYVKTKDWKPNS